MESRQILRTGESQMHLGSELTVLHSGSCLLLLSKWKDKERSTREIAAEISCSQEAEL